MKPVITLALIAVVAYATLRIIGWLVPKGDGYGPDDYLGIG